jgi:hypothetical protein
LTAIVHVDYIRIIEACHAWGLAVKHSASLGGSPSRTLPRSGARRRLVFVCGSSSSRSSTPSP